jgi:hypothetical protein
MVMCYRKANELNQIRNRVKLIDVLPKEDKYSNGCPDIWEM